MTTLFGTPQLMPKPKHSMLPLLVVLFIFSYGLMTLLIVEQGHTIQSQHMLIRELLGDTHELAAMKGKAIREQALSRQAQAKNGSSVQSEQAAGNQPSANQAQAPSTQTPPANAPSSQAGSSKAQPKHSGKAQRFAPAKPASDLVDVRRNLLSI